MSPFKKTLKTVETVKLPHLKTPETVQTLLSKRSKRSSSGLKRVADAYGVRSAGDAHPAAPSG